MATVQEDYRGHFSPNRSISRSDVNQIFLAMFDEFRTAVHAALERVRHYSPDGVDADLANAILYRALGENDSPVTDDMLLVFPEDEWFAELYQEIQEVLHDIGWGRLVPVNLVASEVEESVRAAYQDCVETLERVGVRLDFSGLIEDYIQSHERYTIAGVEYLAVEN